MMKRRWALLLAAALLAGAFAGCSTENGWGGESGPSPSYAALQVRKDCTGPADTDFARSVREFQKLCPDARISYEAREGGRLVFGSAGV